MIETAVNRKGDASEILQGLRCPGFSVSSGAESNLGMENECAVGVKLKR